MKTKEMQRRLQPGWDLLVTKWIGLSGTSEIIKKKEGELRQRFSSDFIRKAKKLAVYENTEKEEQIWRQEKDGIVYPLGEGGILNGLWEMAETYGKTGMEIEIRKIPILQETIEFTELYHINPYLLESKGAFLIGTAHGGSLIRRLEMAGVKVSVIGQITEGPARRLHNGEHIRYLERPGKDELYKLGRQLWQS